ncbi:MAG: pyridoxal 5-phosphate synthase pdxT subunit [Eubacteriales bacterium]|nr:pyridoxal 5-phosphate synthase pdxT subunit [Eubacteriales bacterium]MDN5363684.1 pyridoxal 5-phosphate synthase pdxT subunit [Eubacteriales bacterium]
MEVGVLALQGAFREHRLVLERMGIKSREVKKAEHLEGIDGLIIPGGESTTIGKLLVDFGIREPLLRLIEKGLPLFGTCAGMIVMAKEIVGSRQPRLGVMDIVVRRNAFGRQVDSFETDLEVKGIEGGPVRAVFIRAPYIEAAGEGVEILAEFAGKAVMARQENCLATAFHPELTSDNRIHQLFIQMVEDYLRKK